MILLEDEKKAAPMTQNIGTVNGPVIQQGSGSITLNTKNGVSATDLNSLIEKLISSLPAITDTAAEEIESVKVTWNPCKNKSILLPRKRAGCKRLWQE